MNKAIVKEVSIPASILTGLMFFFIGSFIACGLFVAIGIYLEVKQTAKEELQYTNIKNDTYPMIERRKAQ